MIPYSSFVQIYFTESHKVYFTYLREKQLFSCHLGNVPHDLIHLASYGDMLETHKSNSFVVLQPSLWDILMKLKRHTQILYPKDIAYILLKMGIVSGSEVLEAGTGSGIFTIALSYTVAPLGKVYTYEKEEAFLEKAKKNIALLHREEYIETHLRNIGQEGFLQKNVSHVFLDMKYPVPALPFAYEALASDGFIGMILPTVNQISEVIPVMQELGFIDFEVSELLLRKYKINALRMRPEDHMIGHTGYLLFARKSSLSYARITQSSRQ